jgi:hypothetical protein
MGDFNTPLHYVSELAAEMSLQISHPINPETFTWSNGQTQSHIDHIICTKTHLICLVTTVHGQADHRLLCLNYGTCLPTQPPRLLVKHVLDPLKRHIVKTRIYDDDRFLDIPFIQ